MTIQLYIFVILPATPRSVSQIVFTLPNCLSDIARFLRNRTMRSGWFFSKKAFKIVARNSFSEIARMIDILVDNDVAMEFEACDVGRLHLQRHLNRKTEHRDAVELFTPAWKRGT